MKYTEEQKHLLLSNLFDGKIRIILKNTINPIRTRIYYSNTYSSRITIVSKEFGLSDRIWKIFFKKYSYDYEQTKELMDDILTDFFKIGKINTSTC